MLYYRCPTCKTILADKQIIFAEESEKIKENSKLTDDEKDVMLMELPKKLKLWRQCCLMRIITPIDESKILN